MSDNDGVEFLQWALPKCGYKWSGFRKPRSQVLKRVRERMHQLEIRGGYKNYRQYLKDNPEEWKVFGRFCYISISKFFRDRKLWDYIRDEILSEYLSRNKSGNPVEIWSAGCCNGEEPYSVSIIAEQLIGKPAVRANLRILASDRVDELLSRAREGWYPASALKELTDEELNTYFRKVDSDGSDEYKINQELANPVEFEKRDIREALPARKFDIVFCRNLVFTYFKKEEVKEFMNKLNPILKTEGYLIIGSNEKMPETDWLKQVTSGLPVYRKISESESG
ncbi:MAG TPA: CheR family methyltransferase [Balneolaceae bacterium]|nr:CheR family methyltransferase [Balneolaceae bacterium]